MTKKQTIFNRPWKKALFVFGVLLILGWISGTIVVSLNG